MRKSRLPGLAASLSLAAALAATLVMPTAHAGGIAPGPALAWGDNSAGELGDGTTNSTLVPVKAQLPAGVNLRQVSAGDGFSLGLTGGGRVFAWGAGRHGELGDGTTASSRLPVKVPLPTGVKVIEIAAGNSHALAVTSTHRVLAWGFNGYGELGDGTTTSSDVPVSVRMPPGVLVAAVAAGEQFSLALTTTGKVLAWGRNEFGKLGDGTTRSSDVPVWVKLPRGTTVIGISAGQFHSLALTFSGHVLAWGFNGFGQLGADVGRHSAIPVRVRLPAGTRAVAVSAGGNHSLAVTSRGTVLAWGLNVFGELCRRGGAPDNPHPIPVRLPNETKASAVSGGFGHTVILTRGGQVFECGGDATVQSAVPVRVRLGHGLAADVLSQGSDAHHALVIVVVRVRL